MKIAVMQPYFLPYIGYFQLMSSVDEFVVYDNVQFSKGGWIQRNRILVNGEARLFSLPLQKASDFLDICDRSLAVSFEKERHKILRKIEANYRNAPYFDSTMPLIADCFLFNERNLFEFILHSLHTIRAYLGIEAKLVASSQIEVDHSLKGKERVIEICHGRSANQYVNSIGGRSLYSQEEFAIHGVALSFLQSRLVTYQQFGEGFVANLSIIDVMMFNSLDRIQTMLDEYELVN